MNRKPIIFLLCLAALLVFTLTAAAESTAVTADFDADPAAALALLRAAKTEGADDPSWNTGAKTLTLRGVNFTTTARCAVVLPAGSTLELADGTENFLASGDFVTEETGEKDRERTYVYGLYTAGDLTVRGGGSLTVRAGDFRNTGKSPYSVGLFVGGDLTMWSGNLTAMGGEAHFVEANTDGWAFSVGAEVRGGDVLITGGCLHGIGSFSTAYGDNGEHGSFSRGVMTSDTDVTVSGDGKLRGEVIEAARDNGLKAGITIYSGKLSVADTAEVIGEAYIGVDITGEISLSGGALSCIGSGDYSTGIDLEGIGAGFAKKWSGNFTMTGGTLTVTGGSLYMHAPAEKNKGVFRMTGGTGTIKKLYGAQQLLLEGGSLTVGSDAQPGSVEATAIVLSGGSMDIVAEAWTTSGDFPRGFALTCTTLQMRGGVLSARYKATAEPLQIPAAMLALVLARETADFTGGTAVLDAGVGNIAVLSVAYRYSKDGVTYTVTYTDGIIRMQGDAMHLTGSREALPDGGAVRLTQKYQDSPVTFSDVVRQTVTVTLAALDKRYDGSTDCTLTGILAGADAGDRLFLGTADATAQFDTPDVGADKPVTVTGSFDVAGQQAYKYSLVQPSVAGLTARIDKAEAPTLPAVEHRQKPTETGTQTVALPALPDDAYDLVYTVGAPTLSGAVRADSYAAADGGLIFALSGGADGDTVTFTVTVQSRNYADATCTVTVRLVSYVPGDCNGDGKVTKADLLRLQKYLAGWDVEIDKAAADCNGDGKVTKADLLRLQKYLAGWDVKLG